MQLEHGQEHGAVSRDRPIISIEIAAPEPAFKLSVAPTGKRRIDALAGRL
jgi:hypothetical protein